MENIIGLTRLRVTGGSLKKDYPGNIWRMKFLLASLEQNLRTPLDLHILCPEDELDNTKTLFTSTSKVNLLFENAEMYLPGIGASKANPWRKAQCLMFAFGAQQVKHTLNMDADELLVKPMSESDIWRNNRSATRFIDATLQNRLFWEATQTSFNLQIDVSKDLKSIEPNPFMVSPIICQNIILRLNEIGKTLLDLASEDGWIDFCAYALVANKTCGLLSQHFDSQLAGPNISETRFSHHLRNKTGFITTLQGFLGFTEAETKVLLQKAGIFTAETLSEL